MYREIDSPRKRKEFNQLVKINSSSLIIVKCYADWCGPCKNIKEYVYKKIEELNYSKKMLINLNIDEQSDVASFLKVRSVPTLITYYEGMPYNVCTSGTKQDIDLFFSQIGKL